MNLSPRPLLGIVLILANTLWSPAQSGPRVIAFSPSGSVKQVRQVRATFSHDMVAFGDPRPASAPFSIDCPIPGRGLWVDTRNWVYDFERDLGAGLGCRFSLAKGLQTLTGESLPEQAFFFSTGGPAVIRSVPYQGSERIEENQAFLLQLDAVPQPETLSENVYFTAEGVVEKIGFELIEGDLRRKVLDNYPWLARDLAEEQLVLLQPRRTFPQLARVNLVLGAGVASASGVRTVQDQILPFIVRPEFTATFHCQRENFDQGCIPFSSMRVNFSASVPRDLVAESRLEGANGQIRKPDQPQQETEFVSSVVFPGPFTESTQFTLHLPERIQDDAGRSLSKQARFPLQVWTDAYPPLAKFAADFGILEAREGGLLPVTIRNIEADLELNQRKLDVASRMRGRTYRADSARVSEIMGWLRMLQSRGWDDRGSSIFSGVEANPSFFEDLEMPRSQSSEAFEVLGIPLGERGFFVTEIESQLLGAALLDHQPTMYVPAAALVTDLGVHLKWGIESSLVWVTRLSSGKPVAGAQVEIWDCRAQRLAEARTDNQGVAVFRSGIPSLDEAERCSWEAYHSGLLATARTRDDFSLVHSDWNEGIERWRFSVPTEWDSSLVSAHTILDRSLFRTGETVHMKHLIRRRSTSGFAHLPGEIRPPKLEIQHQGSGQSYEFDLDWEPRGSAVSDWEIPQEARRGAYSIFYKRPEGRSFAAGSFRVEDFRIPLMRARLQGASEDLINPKDVPLDLAIAYFSGGGAGQLPVSIRYREERRSLSGFEGFEGFHFSNGRIKEGVRRSSQSTTPEPPPAINRLDIQLDNQGTGRVFLEAPPDLEQPGQLRVEVEYRDPNGEVLTATASLPIWPSGHLIGLKRDSWALSPELLKFQVAVVNLQGKPVADAPVTVEALPNQTFSHRKRLVGGFYAYEHVTETKNTGPVCEGRTNRRGLLFCESSTSLSGSVFLQASTQDPAGNASFANQNIWIAGADSWWFQVADHDRIDLIPEQPRYEPGQKARFQVRMPFRQATALISVEREGVIDTYVRKLNRNRPVIEIPVLANYAPNVFVSALVVRGRVSGTPPTATVDLGKPAYKLGLGEIKVGWQAHELKVEARTVRQVFQVREKVPVEFQVRTATGARLPAGTELSVAAVDEGLLSLQPNLSWELLQSMMGQRGLGVQTSTAQMQVVGKRHFGLKAIPQGGGGGQENARELFDSLLYWNARVAVDSKGLASLEIPLNDSLSSFRIVAVATAGANLFGTGSTSIRTTQDLMLFSGVPPLVREGDQFSAIFTLRNASEESVEATLAATVSPRVGDLTSHQILLQPGESREMAWQLTAPVGVSELAFDVSITAGNNFSDRIRVQQQVVPAVPVRTFQATISQLEETWQVPVKIPADAIPDRGGIDVVLQNSLTASLAALRDYMQEYPYTCLEQQISRAVAIGDVGLWERTMASLPAYLDGQGLAKYFPTARWGSDVLTAYLLSIAWERGLQIPLPSLEKMLAGSSGFVEGRVVRYSSLPTTDLTLRKLAVLDALSRYGRASNSLVSVISIQPALWPTSGLIDWVNVLSRLTDLPDRSPRLIEVERQIRARLTFRGTTMGFSTESRDRLWWLMTSPDSNSLRLLLALLEHDLWREDLPRLMVGAIGRMKKGRWDLTTANAWGVLAAEKFAARFEHVQVSGQTRAQVSSQLTTHSWPEQPRGGTLSFDWPGGQETLELQHDGGGQPWVMVRSQAAIPLLDPLWSGYTIRRTRQPVERRQPDRWSAGDIVRIRLEIEAQADMTWVVVSDPIPAGASILGTGLGSDSALARLGEGSRGRSWPTFQERTFDSFRSYYSFVPKGSWTLEYTLRLNNPGQFSLPPTRVEAMYHPEVFAELPNSPVEVNP